MRREDSEPENASAAAEADDRLSVVIPVYNEQESIRPLVERCLAAADRTGLAYELILVDDGSRDRSRTMLAEAAEAHGNRIVAVLLNRNYGQHAAVMAGFGQASGDLIVTLDADLQNPPEEIPNVVEKLREGFDVVGTVRVPRHDSTLRKVASWVMNRFAQRATGVRMSDYGCMLRGYRRNVVDALLQCPERSTFIPILANSFADRATEIEVRHDARKEGDSKYSLWKLINLQFDLLTCMTTFPLRMLSVGGAAIAFVGFAFAAFLIVARLIIGPDWAVEGVFTVLAVLFMFVGAQFIGMGLLGEYIGRIYHDVRARPRHFVHSVHGRGLSESS